MKAIRIMSILTMLCAIFSCKAQNKGFESVSADAYEKIIADTTVNGYVVVELDKGYNAWVDEGHKVVK